MKLLLVSPFTSQSGSAIRFWNIALQFRDCGYEVVYIDRSNSTGKPLFRAEGIRYCPSRTFSPLVADILYSTLFTTFMLFRHADCRLYYALKPAPNNCIPALIARLLGKKILLDIDDLDYEYLQPGFKKKIARLFFHFFPRIFPLVTCHTPNLLSFCKKELRLSDDRLFFLAQGVSQEFLNISINDHAPLKKSLLYVATLGISSEFDDLLPLLARICTAHADAAITVVGDGTRRASFEEKAKKLGMGGSISFVGQVPHEKLPEIMTAHYIGINYMRPTPVNECRAILKIREYLACGLQVVCNACGDARLFADVAFVEPNLRSMEERLADLLSRPCEKNTRGRAFIEQRFSWKQIMDDFILTSKILSPVE
jgi:glycosyltransferase involved in cell wall biosynthesis